MSRYMPAFPTVEAAERIARFGHRGAVVWFTGLSGSGKSTLAGAVERRLFDMGWAAAILDGDEFRREVSSDLGFSETARTENIRRAAGVGKLLASSGLVVLAAFVSPRRCHRATARQIVRQSGVPFLEVYVSTPLDVCRERDVKGLYARAAAGEIADFTGVSAAYEPSTTAELSIDTATVDIGCAAERVVLALSVVSRLHEPGAAVSTASELHESPGRE